MSSNTNTTILETKNVSREIIRNSTNIKTVDSISYNFKKGGIYNLIGPSGAGKTSFLRLLNRLDEVTGGEILFQNKPIVSYRSTELRKKISMLFQEPYLFPGTVRNNFEYCFPREKLENIEIYLEKVGLNPEFIDRDSFELSIGEKQRVAFARSLLMKPDIILLDEPTASLDPSLSNTVEKLIISLSVDLELVVIIVTHDPEQAKRLGGETLLLVAGKLVEAGKTEIVLSAPSTELGQKYIRRELK